MAKGGAGSKTCGILFDMFGRRYHEFPFLRDIELTREKEKKSVDKVSTVSSIFYLSVVTLHLLLSWHSFSWHSCNKDTVFFIFYIAQILIFKLFRPLVEMLAEELM